MKDWAAAQAETVTYSVLYTFTGGAEGANPAANLIVDAAGNLYGTTPLGGAYGRGVVFKLETQGSESVLYSFTGGTDGGVPAAGLVMDAGNLMLIAMRIHCFD